MSWVTELARREIVALQAYQPAAWEPELVRLHANELPWRLQGDESRAGLNRYPEPQPRALIERLAALYEVISGEAGQARAYGSDAARPGTARRSRCFPNGKPVARPVLASPSGSFPV